MAKAPLAGEESGSQVLELDRAELADRMIGKTPVLSAANWLDASWPSPARPRASRSAGSSTPVGTSMTGSTGGSTPSNRTRSDVRTPLKARCRAPHVRAPSSVKRPTVLQGLRCASYCRIKAFGLRPERHIGHASWGLLARAIGIAASSSSAWRRTLGKRFRSIAGNDYAVHLEAAGTAGDCRAVWWVRVRRVVSC